MTDHTTDAPSHLPSLQRVAAVATTDPGIFLLSACSFVEGYLYASFVQPGEQADFPYLLSCMERALKRQIRPMPNFAEVARLLRMHRSNSNKVRHEFASFDLDEARAATAMLIMFCDLMQIQSSALQEIQEGLELWTSAIRPVDQLKQLHAMRAEVNRQHLENGALLRELTDLREAKIDQVSVDAALYLDYIQRFSAYTRSRADYERSVMTLTPEQERVVQLIGNGTGDFLVTGPAGTGKTLVLLHAMAKELSAQQQELSLEVNQQQVALLTFTPTLVRFNRWLTQLMGAGSIDPLVQTVDGFFASRLKMIDPNIQVQPQRILSLLPDPLPVEGSSSDIAFEVDRVIIASGCSFADYIERGDPALSRLNPDRADRQILWNHAERLRQQMEREGVVSYGFTYRVVSATVRNDVRNRQRLLVRRIFVDEAQDLTPGVLAALKLLSRSGIVIAGDVGQAVWRRGFSFRSAGIMVQGRTRHLSANFRNTRPVCTIAEGWRRRSPEDVDASPMDGASTAVVPWRDGPQPEFQIVADQVGVPAAVIERLQLFIDTLEYDPENIAVLTLLRDTAPALRQAITNAGIATADMRDADFDFQTVPGVRVSSVAAAKGVEFPVVILVISSLTFLDHDHNGEMMRQFRNVVYVGLTRAVDNLVLLGTQEVSREGEIEDLLKLFT